MDLAGTADFTSCLFTGCQSSTTGGAIQVARLSSTVYLSVVSTGFTACHSTQGGAIYAQGGKFKMSKSCIDQCSASDYSALFAASQTQSLCDMQNSYISNINDQDAGNAVGLDFESPTLNAVNFTQIVIRNCQGVLYSVAQLTTLECECMYISDCDAKAIVYVAGYATPFTKVNFVRNRGRNELVHGSSNSYRIVMQDCAFVKDVSVKLANTYTNFNNCLFSDVFDPNQFPSGFDTIACSFGVGWQTKSFEIYGSEGCWVLVSKSPTPAPPSDGPTPPAADGKRGPGVAFILFVCVFVIGAGLAVAFVFLRWWKSRDDGGRLLQMYAQV
jgi:hypothetical protein